MSAGMSTCSHRGQTLEPRMLFRRQDVERVGETSTIVLLVLHRALRCRERPPTRRIRAISADSYSRISCALEYLATRVAWEVTRLSDSAMIAMSMLRMITCTISIKTM